MFFFPWSRYVSKENDTWIHALLKDLIIEAGSGLIILDPVDISGGYTSGKKKTNMSLMSTDVFLHLSLGVLSLLLNLHSQVATALQFGNMVPLASCTNFNQIWMSPKGHLSPQPYWNDLMIYLTAYNAAFLESLQTFM